MFNAIIDAWVELHKVIVDAARIAAGCIDGSARTQGRREHPECRDGERERDAAATAARGRARAASHANAWQHSGDHYAQSAEEAAAEQARWPVLDIGPLGGRHGVHCCAVCRAWLFVGEKAKCCLPHPSRSLTPVCPCPLLLLQRASNAAVRLAGLSAAGGHSRPSGRRELAEPPPAVLWLGPARKALPDVAAANQCCSFVCLHGL